jgi:hypothetical protein
MCVELCSLKVFYLSAAKVGMLRVCVCVPCTCTHAIYFICAHVHPRVVFSRDGGTPGAIGMDQRFCNHK